MQNYYDGLQEYTRPRGLSSIFLGGIDFFGPCDQNTGIFLNSGNVASMGRGKCKHAPSSLRIREKMGQSENVFTSEAQWSVYCNEVRNSIKI